MRYALIGLIAVAAAGCASLQATAARSTEHLLGTAGFWVEAADTPAKLADLQAPGAMQLLREERDGRTVYVYRDPIVCHCIHIGGEPEYQHYKRLRLRKYEQEQWEKDIERGYSSAFLPYPRVPSGAHEASDVHGPSTFWSVTRLPLAVTVPDKSNGFA